jgi:hypothetical protein
MPVRGKKTNDDAELDDEGGVQRKPCSGAQKFTDEGEFPSRRRGAMNRGREEQVLERQQQISAERAGIRP